MFFVRFRVHENAAPLKRRGSDADKHRARCFRVHENAAPLKLIIPLLAQDEAETRFRVHENAAPLKQVSATNWHLFLCTFPRS